MRKRIVSIVLALCMVLALMPQMAFAAGEGNPYTLKEGTAGAGENEGPGSLIDGAVGTKWCVTDFESAYIIFSTDSPINVSGYSITTGNDNAENRGRNPKNWTLYGCNDYTGSGTDTLEKIHSDTKDTILQDENNKTYNFAFDKKETAYQYYKLEITAIQGGDVMQMSEFALTSCDHNWITSASVAPTCTAAGYTTRTCDGCGGTDYVYLKPVDHDFTGEDGGCTYCGYSYDVLHQGYVDENGISRKLNDNTTEITEGLTSWDNTNGGWYIVKCDVTLDNVTVSGDVHLILADGCTLTVNGNIQGGNLTIYGQNGGTGKLFVSSITSGSGKDENREGERGGNGGSITINGGMVNVGNIKSGTGGNGGTAYDPEPEVSGGSGGKGGNITINGGIVEADSITSGTGGTGGYGYTKGGNGGNGGSSSAGRNGNDGIVVSIVINTGIVFQGNSGQVYGARATLSENFAIPAGKTLTIDSGKTLIILQGKNLTVSEGATLTSSGTISNNGKIYVDGTFTGTADNLYYPFTIVNATASGDTSEYNSKNYGKAGCMITLSPAPPDGYKFEQWSFTPAVTTSETNTFTMPSVALTVTAQSSLITYNITYDLDGGTAVNLATYTVESNKIVLSNPTKENYTFTGWSGTGLSDENNMTVTIPKGSTGHRTYTAHWTPDTYTVNLNTNGGTINSGNVTSYTYGQEATLPTDVTKAGYTFKGWYENENFTGNPVTVIGTTEKGEKTFYAKWAANSYYPISQKPTIEAGEGVKVTLSADGKTATITADDGYEIADVMLNGVSLGKVAEVKNLKTGDKLVLTAEKKAAVPTKEEILAALADQQLTARSKLVTMKNGKKAIKIIWYNENGETMDFDGVEIYRSAKRYSGYGKKPIFTTEKSAYYNTAIQEGTKYYYKVRGFVIIDGQKHYTDYSRKAIRTAN